METILVKRKRHPNRTPIHLLKETLDGQGDLMIYDHSQVSLFDAHYFKMPPLVNIEIDVEIDNRKTG